MKFEHTTLQIIEFGNSPEDRYYCLIDERISPGGLDVQKIRLTDPRNIDLHFRQNGCLLMLDGNEIQELARRGELDENNLHVSVYQLAVREKLIQED